jgi:hypothetical protein
MLLGLVEVCLQVLLVILLPFYNYLLCWKLQHSHVSNEHFYLLFFILLVIFQYLLLLFCNSLHFGIVKQGLRWAPPNVFLFKKIAKHLMKAQWINDSNDIYICYEENLRIWWNIWDCIICWNEIVKIAWLFDKHVLKWPRYYGIYIHSRLRFLLKPNFKLIIFIIYGWTYSDLGLAHCLFFN